MKPFQALYFVCHNLSKAVTVFIMIALTGLLYVGGSYISNIEVEFIKTYEPEADVAFVNLNGMTAEQGKERLQQFSKEIILQGKSLNYGSGLQQYTDSPKIQHHSSQKQTDSYIIHSVQGQTTVGKLQ